jgi:intein/homing endonuclease
VEGHAVATISDALAENPTKDGMEIPIYKAHGIDCYAIVDAEDFERMSQFRWNLTQNGYVRESRHDGQTMHRMILGLTVGDGKEVDHRNRNKLDNRRSNIYVCTRSQNVSNRGLFKKNKSGITGVAWIEKTGYWCAYLNVRGKRVHTSYHREQVDAVAARAAAVIAHA